MVQDVNKGFFGHCNAVISLFNGQNNNYLNEKQRTLIYLYLDAKRQIDSKILARF